MRFSYISFEDNNELKVFVYTRTLRISEEGGGKGTLLLAGELWGDAHKYRRVPVWKGKDITYSWQKTELDIIVKFLFPVHN